MPKEELKGVVTREGKNTGASGRMFTWFTLNMGSKGSIRVIGFHPVGIGPRCDGLDSVHPGFSVRVTGVRKGDTFFAEKVVKVAKTFSPSHGGPPAKRGPWVEEGIVVSFRHGKEKDWLEIVNSEGDQVPVTMQPGVLDKNCLGSRFKFTGTASGNGFRHGKEVQTLEDA